MILCIEVFEMSEIKVLAAAYVPFKTFLTSLDHLKGHGVPNIIDRSVFPSFSGAVQSQVISALTFLELITDKGIPTKELDELVNDVDHRKANIKKILEKKYKNLFDADLARITPSQFESLFSPEIYGVSGDTKKKSRTFLFYALDFAGVPYSKLLTQRTRSSKSKSKTNNDPPKMGAETAVKPQTSIAPETLEQSKVNEHAIKTIYLAESNKSVWIGTDANMFEIKRGKDLDFVLELIRLFDEYETNNKKEETKLLEETMTTNDFIPTLNDFK